MPERCVPDTSDLEREPEPQQALVCDVGPSLTAVLGGCWRGPRGTALVPLLTVTPGGPMLQEPGSPRPSAGRVDHQRLQKRMMSCDEAYSVPEPP